MFVMRGVFLFEKYLGEKEREKKENTIGMRDDKLCSVLQVHVIIWRKTGLVKKSLFFFPM